MLHSIKYGTLTAHSTNLESSNATGGEWPDHVRMLIPVAPTCLLLCNRSVTASEFRSSEDRSESKNTKMRNIFWKYHQENCDATIHKHVAEHWDSIHATLFPRLNVRASVLGRCMHRHGRTQFFKRWKMKEISCMNNNNGGGCCGGGGGSSSSGNGHSNDTGILSHVMGHIAWIALMAGWLADWFVGGNVANNSQCKQNLLSSVSRAVCVNESACSHTSSLCAPAKF